MKFSVLVGIAIKVLKQAAEMKHERSAYILIPTLARYSTAKVGIKMHALSFCVSSHLLVSGLFIAVPTNTENFNFFRTLVCVRTFSIYTIV